MMINKLTIKQLQDLEIKELLAHEKEVWQYFQVTNKVREFKEMQQKENERGNEK